MDFTAFDSRRYTTLPPVEGYRQWAPTYEDTVPDALDIRLLDRLESIDWVDLDAVVDLACGTGRTGAWLAGKGVRALDGVDFTSAMLDRARTRAVHRSLVEADVRRTGLRTGAYELAVLALADEHLEDLAPLYREAARLTMARGRFVIVGYHPHFLMLGVPTHFTAPGGEARAILSFVHLFSDHVCAAHRAGWTLVESHEGVVDDEWIAVKPRWADKRSHPVSYAMVWAKR